MSDDEIRMNALVKLEIKNNVYAKEIWNAAIEKAAYWLETANRNDTDDANEIRKLKV